MDIGMLWKDDTPARPLADKIMRAADYYAAKYGEQPTVCVMHPATLGDDAAETLAGCRLLTAKTVQVNHFWMGVENENLSAMQREG